MAVRIAPIPSCRTLTRDLGFLEFLMSRLENVIVSPIDTVPDDGSPSDVSPSRAQMDDGTRFLNPSWLSGSDLP
jgi:hypothetical protein